MALIDALAVDAFGTSQEIEDNTNWSSNALSPVVDRTVIGGLTTEKWLNLGSSSLSRTVNRPDPVTSNDTEVHFLLNFEIGVTGGSGTIAFLKNNAATSGEGIDLRYGPSSAGAGAPSVLFIRETSLGTLTDTNLEDFQMTAGATFHVVMRAKSQTDGNTDGEFEVFINGVKVLSRLGIAWGTSPLDRLWNNTGFLFSTGISNQTYVRDIYIYDAYTTANDVMPQVGILLSSLPTSVTGSYTNEGGAVDLVTALSDNDDLTFAKSSAPGDELALGFTVDPAVAALPIQSVIVQTRLGRDSAAFNNVDFELRDAAGVAVLDSETVPVSAINPARQAAFRQLVPNASTDADDFSVVIRNGS